MSKLRVRTVAGDSLSENQLREMWRLRLSFKDTTQGFDFEADYARFAEFCRSCGHVFLCVDQEGTLRGLYVIKVELSEWRGRKYVRVTPEYAYVEKAYRGSGATRMAYLRLAPTVLRHVGLPIYGTATITPSSYLLYTDAFHVFTHGDDDVPDWERSLLDEIGYEFGGSDWNPDTKLLGKAAKLQGEQRPPRFRSRAHELAYANYVSQNPNWQDGFQLVCVFPISLKAIPPTVWGAIQRALRNRRAAKSPR